MIRRSVLPCILLLQTLAGLSPDSYGLSMALTTEDLVSAADQVMTATVTDVVQPDPDQWILQVYLSVEVPLKGVAKKGNTYVYEISGGVVRGRGLISSETPRPQPGERVILFLKDSEMGTNPYVGGQQGCLKVDGDSVAGKGVYLDAYIDYIRGIVEKHRDDQGEKDDE